MSHIIHLHRRRLRQCQGAFQVHNVRHDIGKVRLIEEARLQRGIQTRPRIRARLRRHLALGSGRREFDLARLRNGRRRETDTSNGGDNTGAGDGARDERRGEAIGFDFGPGVFVMLLMGAAKPSVLRRLLKPIKLGELLATI